MITALKVEIADKGKGIFKIINSLKKDKISVEFFKARGVCLKQITYKSYKNRINIKNLDDVTGYNKNRLLCSEKLKFPTNSGYKRFYTPYLSARLCTNMALEIIKNSENNKNLKIGFYDINGDFSKLMFMILQYTSNLFVVTNNNEVYDAELEYAMNEIGATAIVTKQKSELLNCNLVIAPMQITEPLPIKSDAILLTNQMPLTPQSGLTYYKYQIHMPNGFAKIKPSELDEEYFCSALYVLEKQHELGTIIPISCSNSSSSQTVKSICDYLVKSDVTPPTVRVDSLI